MAESYDDKRRRFLVTGLSTGMLAVGNALSLFQASHAMGRLPDRLPEGRSIYELKGQVTIDGRQASIDTIIGPNSTITTKKDSRIIFAVGSSAYILRANGELKLESSNGLLVEGMRIISGKILSVFGKREAPHMILTSTATIGIRGTGIYVESDPEKSYVCTCYGSTRIVSNADPAISEDVVATNHDKPLYIYPGNAGSKIIRPAPVINHRNSELRLIEALVGRKPPFSAGYSVGGGEGGY